MLIDDRQLLVVHVFEVGFVGIRKACQTLTQAEFVHPIGIEHAGGAIEVRIDELEAAVASESALRRHPGAPASALFASGQFAATDA